MILPKWEPNLERIAFDDDKMPVWVHFRNVPLELFNRTGLSYVASGVGVPLYMDSMTASRKRLAYAKVCVEIKANSVIPDFLNVVLANGSIATVRVLVPWMPARCFPCIKFGHEDKACTKNIGKAQVWQVKTSNSGTNNTVESKDVLGTSQSLIEVDESAISLAPSLIDVSSIELGSTDAKLSLVDSNVSMVANDSQMLGNKKSQKEADLELSASKASSSVKSNAAKFPKSSSVSSKGKAKLIMTGSTNRFQILNQPLDDDLELKNRQKVNSSEI